MLKILPNGFIKGGNIAFIYDQESEIANVSGAVKVGVSILTKTINFNQQKSVKKELLKSTAFWKGRKENIEGVDIEVISNNGQIAIINFSHDSDTGIAELSLEKEYIDIIRIVGKTKYADRSITIEAVRV